VKIDNGQRVAFGIRLANSGPLASPAAMFSLARRSEQRGFDSVWVHDHISWARDRITHFSAGAIEACADQDPAFFESVTTVAAVGAILDRARVGIAGLALPLRDPRILAKQLASVDTMLGGGRVILAIGVGSQPEDFRVMGVPWQRRGRITNDYLAALRAILSESGPVDFASDSVSFERGTFHPSGHGVQLWVAASSSAGRARAARLADGWLSGAQPVKEYGTAAADWRSAVEQAHRDPGMLTAAYETFACIKESYEQAVSLAEASLTHMYGGLPEGLERAIVGTPEACIDRIQQLVNLGASSFELRLVSRTGAEMEDMVDLVAETVLPAFGIPHAEPS
jgi:alkanesulfonate monooxygenase SsuD/methylene tetrahydromethanopterin reductase-like flavin-dependent oxidoreductase (luciferase family)